MKYLIFIIMLVSRLGFGQEECKNDNIISDKKYFPTLFDEDGNKLANVVFDSDRNDNYMNFLLSIERDLINNISGKIKLCEEYRDYYLELLCKAGLGVKSNLYNNSKDLIEVDYQIDFYESVLSCLEKIKINDKKLEGTFDDKIKALKKKKKN